jgi:hypothetical protein
MPRITLRLRYRTLKLRALCWVSQRDKRRNTKMPLIGRACCVMRPDQGQKVTGLGGSQARITQQYSGQIQAILAAAPPSEP